MTPAPSAARPNRWRKPAVRCSVGSANSGSACPPGAESEGAPPSGASSPIKRRAVAHGERRQLQPAGTPETRVEVGGHQVELLPGPARPEEGGAASRPAGAHRVTPARQAHLGDAVGIGDRAGSEGDAIGAGDGSNG